MKKNIILGTFFVLSLSVFLIGCEKKDTLIKVNDNPITKDVFYEELKEKYGKELMTEMIKKQLLLKEVKVEKKEINKTVNDMISKYGVKNREELKDFLNLHGTEFDKEVEFLTAETKFLKEKLNIKGNNENNGENFLDSYVTVDYVAFKDKKIAEKVLKNVKKGDSLEKAAHKEQKDYYLSFHWQELKSYSDLPDKVDLELKKLKAGQVTPIIQIDNSYFLYELKNIEDPKIGLTEFDYVRNAATQKGYNSEKMYQELTKESKIEVIDKSFSDIVEK